MTKITIEEAESGAQTVENGLIFVYCDCNHSDPCPQTGKIGGNHCRIRISADRLKRKEVKKLQRSQR